MQITQFISHIILNICKGEIVILYWRNQADFILMKWSKWTSWVIRYVNLISCNTPRRTHYFCCILTKNTQSRFYHGKHETNPSWRIINKITAQYFSKASRLFKIKKDGGCLRLEETCRILNWILDLNIRGTIDRILIRPTN